MRGSRDASPLRGLTRDFLRFDGYVNAFGRRASPDRGVGRLGGPLDGRTIDDSRRHHIAHSMRDGREVAKRASQHTAFANGHRQDSILAMRKAAPPRLFARSH